MPRKLIPFPLPEHFTFGLIAERSEARRKYVVNANDTPLPLKPVEHDEQEENISLKECLQSRLFWSNAFCFNVN